jgi:hypothetical protein
MDSGSSCGALLIEDLPKCPWWVRFVPFGRADWEFRQHANVLRSRSLDQFCQSWTSAGFVPERVRELTQVIAVECDWPNDLFLPDDRAAIVIWPKDLGMEDVFALKSLAADGLIADDIGNIYATLRGMSVGEFMIAFAPSTKRES